MFARLRASRFVRDAAVLQVAAGFTSLGNLLSTLALAFLLGSRLQGIFYMAMALYSMFYLLGNVGLSTVTVSHIAQSIGAGDRRGVVAWLAFLAKAGLLLALLMLALAYFFLPAVGDHFFDDERIGEWAVLLCVLPLLELPRVVCAAAFQGTRRMLNLAQLENSIEAGRVFLVISGILITGRPEGAVWGTLAAGALGSCLALILYRRARQELLADPTAKAVLPGLRELVAGRNLLPLSKGLPMGLQVGVMRNLDALALDVAPMLVMGYFGGPAQAAYFRIAQRFLRMPLMFLQGISRTAVPAMAELAHVDDPTRFRRAFYRATFGGGVLIGTGLLVALPLIPVVTRHFLPPDYRLAVPHDAYILVGGFLVTSFSAALESFYVAAHRVQAALRIGFFVGVPLILLMVVSGYFFGPNGVLVGFALAMSVGLAHHAYIWRCFQAGDVIRTRTRLSFQPEAPA